MERLHTGLVSFELINECSALLLVASNLVLDVLFGIEGSPYEH